MARKNRMKLIAVGGVADHIHLLISLSKTLDIAHAMQLIKGGSSNGSTMSFPRVVYSSGKKAMALSQ
jgi:REP element-mobilizing transposase RayT